MDKYDVAEKVLRKAREYVRQGWTQGVSAEWDEEHEKMVYCSSGAIRMAVVDCMEEIEGKDFYPQPRSRELENLALRRLENAMETEHVIFWNDEDERTHDEVLRAFDRALNEEDMSNG